MIDFKWYYRNTQTHKHIEDPQHFWMLKEQHKCHLNEEYFHKTMILKKKQKYLDKKNDNLSVDEILRIAKLIELWCFYT